jgi:hypothetical protein
MKYLNVLLIVILINSFYLIYKLKKDMFTLNLIIHTQNDMLVNKCGIQ